MICSYKCKHCLDPESWLHSPLERGLVGDLRALSLACRQLRSISQEIMFHDVHPSCGILPVLHTLFARPDLAAQVQSFSNDLCMASLVTERDFQFFRHLAGRFRLCEVDKWMQTIRHDGFEREVWILEFTLALLPNVTALFITVPACNLGYEYVLGKLFANSVTMSSVKRLFLYHFDYNNCKIDLGRLGNFLGMMPCLERLDVNFCGGATQFLPLHELRSLRFAQSNISAASLKRLVMSCPKLECFEWCSPEANRNINDEADEDAGEFTSEEVQEILRQRKSTLKHVNIGFHSYFPRIDGAQTVWRGRLGAFVEFAALEKLLVRVSSFEERLVGKFINLLPKSLMLLGLRDIPKRWNGVGELANAVGNGHFSKLKKVVLDLGQDELKVARAQLAIVGVTCVRYDYDDHPLGRHLPCKWYLFCRFV